ncbi:hypothetical protein PF003_g37407 [Phytophthora fragariae]|nr:hypothetical protein PF003_g37407 [Phytophthora fragariae]
MDRNMGVEQRVLAEELAIVLVANYAEIATRLLDPMEASFEATPGDHPVIVNLRATDAVELMIHDNVMGPSTTWAVTHHGDVTATLKKFMAPDVEVHRVHPHPALSRLV